jgi:hypothetical protein
MVSAIIRRSKDGVRIGRGATSARQAHERGPLTPQQELKTVLCESDNRREHLCASDSMQDKTIADDRANRDSKRFPPVPLLCGSSKTTDG